MKSNLLVLSFLVVLASCSTAYKSGQTPDDVYYSPEPPRDSYVRTEKKQDEDTRYYDEDRYRDDRYLRMKIADRRWSGLYDDYYSYNPYNYHYINSSLYYNSPWSSYSYWNFYYNPNNCCCSQVYHGGYAVVRNKPRMFDMSVYNNQPVSSVRNTKAGSYNPVGYGSAPSGSSSSTRRSSGGNYRGSNSNAGDFLRGAFGGNNNSGSSNTGSSSGRSSSSSSSSGSSGSRSSAPTTAPSRKF